MNIFSEGMPGMPAADGKEPIRLPGGANGGGDRCRTRVVPAR